MDLTFVIASILYLIPCTPAPRTFYTKEMEIIWSTLCFIINMNGYQLQVFSDFKCLLKVILAKTED